jgi:hypothetical protein
MKREDNYSFQVNAEQLLLLDFKPVLGARDLPQDLMILHHWQQKMG